MPREYFVDVQLSPTSYKPLELWLTRNHAGSGKTTFMQRINAHLHAQLEPPYVINLDPAVRNVPFDSNIDIRDSINYKEVMKSYNLGPNGKPTFFMFMFIANRLYRRYFDVFESLRH
jgi:hypothetical protein